jgi:hypothetical protein
MKYYVYGAKVMYSLLSISSFTGILDKTEKFFIQTGGLVYKSDAKLPPNDYFCGVFNWNNR